MTRTVAGVVLAVLFTVLYVAAVAIDEWLELKK